MKYLYRAKNVLKKEDAESLLKRFDTKTADYIFIPRDVDLIAIVDEELGTVYFNNGNTENQPDIKQINNNSEQPRDYLSVALSVIAIAVCFIGLLLRL